MRWLLNKLWAKCGQTAYRGKAKGPNFRVIAEKLGPSCSVADEGFETSKQSRQCAKTARISRFITGWLWVNMAVLAASVGKMWARVQVRISANKWT